ncbi:MAG: AlpA family transcriptional regulator [Methylobacter sp.]|jgi:predicted DNA-binding transcriptional regulator AlpA
MEANIPQQATLPEIGFVRINVLVNNPKKNIQGVMGIGRTTWLDGVKSGIYPKPIKIGRSTLWKVEQIRELIEKLGSASQARGGVGTAISLEKGEAV